MTIGQKQQNDVTVADHTTAQYVDCTLCIASQKWRIFITAGVLYCVEGPSKIK